MDLSALKDRLIEAAAAAALLGGGAQVVNTAIDVGQHDTRIERIESAEPQVLRELRDIRADVRSTRETVIRLEGKMEGQNEQGN